MSRSAFAYTLLHVAQGSAARRGTLSTPHGLVQTPAFMPVGTQGTVKGLTIEQLRETGAEVLLGNTYHLLVRPGHETVAALGGLHGFMRWDGPILTDSGGFQIFSLAKLTRLDETGARFRSHVDGSLIELTPERAVAIQEALGSDLAMVLDDVAALPAERERIAQAMQRSLRWAQRCRDAHRREDQALLGIVQGGLEPDLRLESAEQLVRIGFTGYAIGGLSVGETPEEMYRVLDYTVPVLPADRPRYLMGVGRPQDLLAAIARGIDMFDCVMPTRNGRNALAFTDDGPLRLRNRKFERDSRPLEPDCPCTACRHSRGYLRHLFMAKEMLGPVLLSIHNLTYYQRLLQRAREAIMADRFTQFHTAQQARWEAAAQQNDAAQ